VVTTRLSPSRATLCRSDCGPASALNRIDLTGNPQLALWLRDEHSIGPVQV
jgi:hypothetical protein